MKDIVPYWIPSIHSPFNVTVMTTDFSECKTLYAMYFQHYVEAILLITEKVIYINSNKLDIIVKS